MMDNHGMILVIDDDPNTRNVLKSSLTVIGYNVVTAEDGLKGVNQAIVCHPDIILLDMRMPDINGYGVLQRLKSNENTRNIPVIFLTGEVNVEDRVKTLEAGAVDYITKPFYIKEVIARIKIHLRLREYEEELTKKNRELEEFSDLLLELNAKLEEMARKDELTQIWNRRAFNEQINHIHSFSTRYQHPYSIIVVDLDHFKHYNDLYGHQAGDIVLQKVAKAISNTSRTTDFVARFGGEEIVVLLPETGENASYKIAQRTIKAVQDLNIQHEDNENLGIVTVSAGVATYTPGQDYNNNDGWEKILKLADDALYMAKDSGRNRVCRI